jgi:hypothetical protein
VFASQLVDREAGGVTDELGQGGEHVLGQPGGAGRFGGEAAWARQYRHRRREFGGERCSVRGRLVADHLEADDLAARTVK